MSNTLSKDSLKAIHDYFKPLTYSAYYRNSGYNAGNERYYEICTMKSSDDVSNGGSLLLEAFFGDFGNQAYCQLQISTRVGLKIAGIKNGAFVDVSDIVITKDTSGLYHLYLKQRANRWCEDNIIIKKYSDGIISNINKFLPSPTSSFSGSKVWEYSTDTKLTTTTPANYQSLKATSITTNDLKSILVN